MVMVAWDTDRIKNYVFATRKLREIRGASALLDILNGKECVQLVDADPLIYAGGGGAMAECHDQAQAQRLIQEEGSETAEWLTVYRWRVVMFYSGQGSLYEGMKDG